MFKRTFIALLGAAFLTFAGAASPAQRVAHRIVSLSPTATEDLFAIGAGQQVIAADNVAGEMDYLLTVVAREALSGAPASGERSST